MSEPEIEWRKTNKGSLSTVDLEFEMKNKKVCLTIRTPTLREFNFMKVAALGQVAQKCSSKLDNLYNEIDNGDIDEGLVERISKIAEAQNKAMNSLNVEVINGVNVLCVDESSDVLNDLNNLPEFEKINVCSQVINSITEALGVSDDALGNLEGLRKTTQPTDEAVPLIASPATNTCGTTETI